MRTLTCPRCGKKFTTKGTSTIYCPECRPAVKRERDRLYELKRKKPDEGRSAKDTHFCDTPERIAVCLSCPLPPDKCYGQVCDRLKKVPGHEYQRRGNRGRKE